MAGPQSQEGSSVLLHFDLKIDYNSTFTETRLGFLVEIEIQRPQKIEQKIKTYSQYQFAKKTRALAQQLDELEREPKNTKFWLLTQYWVLF